MATRCGVINSLIQKITRDLIAQWPLNTTLNAREQMQSISLSVILQTVFGIYQGERFDRIREKLVELLSLTDSPLKSSYLFIPQLQRDLGAWSTWGKFQRNLIEIDKLVYQEIAECRSNYQPDRTDILNLLIGSKDADGHMILSQVM